MSLAPTLSTNKRFPRWRTLSFETPYWLYVLHRVLFRATNGLWNDGISAILKLINGNYDRIDTSNSIFSFTEADISKVATKLERDGFCVLDQRVPDEVVNQILEFSGKTKVKGVLPTDNYRRDGFRWSEEDYPQNFSGKSARCVYEIKDIINQPTLQKLTFDPFFLSIANRYLGVKPILSLVYMWWSFAVPNKEQFAEVSAQAFHFDMDRIKWLNFFVYVNDVDTENGPHCYVRGSHRRLPGQFRKRGRFTDQDVSKAYGDDVVELTGKRGTIIAVDTRGLHKGKLLTHGERLLFQLIFSNSMFGQKYDRVKSEIKDPAIQSFADRYWQSYFNIL